MLRGEFGWYPPTELNFLILYQASKCAAEDASWSWWTAESDVDFAARRAGAGEILINVWRKTLMLSTQYVKSRPHVLRLFDRPLNNVE